LQGLPVEASIFLAAGGNWSKTWLCIIMELTQKVMQEEFKSFKAYRKNSEIINVHKDSL
jgi:hypothetical protein